MCKDGVDLRGEFRFVRDEGTGAKEYQGAEQTVKPYVKVRQVVQPNLVERKQHNQQRQYIPPSAVDDADATKRYDRQYDQQIIDSVRNEVSLCLRWR